jgi:polysaccharide export outer membrane protein
MFPVRIAMPGRKALIASIFLISSVAAPSWGNDLQLVASGKWDLWDDTGGSAKPDREKGETPAETRTETRAAPVHEPSDAGKTAKSDDGQTAEADAGHQPDSKTVKAVQVPEQPGNSERKDADIGRTEKAGSSDKSTASASTETDIKAKEAGIAADSLPDGAGTVSAGTGAEYIIGPGDFLDVSVWKDEVLSRTVVVLADGTISFPLIGKIRAAGRTIAQVKDEIVKKLVRYYPEPEVNIEVKQSNSMLIYVIGRVNAPGRQVLNANIDVIQALAMAGGLNPFASRNKIKILRKERDKTVVLPFRYNDVIEGKIETNVELKRGDVIVVP